MTPLTYTDLFNRACLATPKRVALIDETGEFTYSQLQGITNRFANALIAHGFPPETPFALLSPNSSLALASLMGGLRAGGAWGNINLRNSLASNIDILSRGACEAIFFHSSCTDMLPEIKAGVKTLRIAVCIDKDIGDYPSIMSYAQGAPETPVNVRLNPFQIGLHGSTGGTTGLPKITANGEAFVSMSCLGMMMTLQLDEPPLNLAMAPITHGGGIIALATLAMGGTVVMMGKPDLEQLLRNLEKYKISVLFLPPTVIYALLKHPLTAKADFSSLRYLISAAAPIAIEKLLQAHAVFGPVVCQLYGQTESGMPLTFISPREVTAAISDGSKRHRLGSVGRQTPNVSAIEIMDEQGKLLPAGEIGEIVVQGPMVMHRYRNDPQATEDIQKFGWHHTGDLGFRDADGYIYISDRKRDLIISGGFNVFPFEVEQALLTHPAVQDCAVFGVPDEKWGEAVRAAVELSQGAKASEQELIQLCKEKLGGVKAPKAIDFVSQLPRSPVGKILKGQLREIYWRGNGRQV